MKIICTKEEPHSLCKIEETVMEPCRVYCSVCKKFVFPDRYHKVRWEMDEMDIQLRRLHGII